MKHLFAALAICVATSTQQIEAETASISEKKLTLEIVEEFLPDFSIITIDHAREY
ncbi:MAG: hypothetical protein JKY03_07495, partial [Aureispira sp.]|nr:hypothetical protein [Aureispira sp.]